MATTPKPLPCPFCGSAPVIHAADPAIEADQGTRVACTSPRCPANPVVTDGLDPADGHGAEACKVAAVERWNTRSNSAVQYD